MRLSTEAAAASTAQAPTTPASHQFGTSQTSDHRIHQATFAATSTLHDQPVTHIVEKHSDQQHTSNDPRALGTLSGTNRSVHTRSRHYPTRQHTCAQHPLVFGQQCQEMESTQSQRPLHWSLPLHAFHMHRIAQRSARLQRQGQSPRAKPLHECFLTNFKAAPHDQHQESRHWTTMRNTATHRFMIKQTSFEFNKGISSARHSTPTQNRCSSLRSS